MKDVTLTKNWGELIIQVRALVLTEPESSEWSR